MKAKVILEDGRQVEIEINESDLQKLEKPKSYKRWRAEVCGLYWCINDSGYIVHASEAICISDDLRHATGNYFQTREEAEAYREKLIKTQAIKDRIAELNEGWKPNWGNDNQDKYCIEYYKGRIRVECYDSIQSANNDLQMRSQEVAEQILAEFGEDLKVLFQ